MSNKLKSKIIADSYNSWLVVENEYQISEHSLSMMEGVDGFCGLDYKEEENAFYINTGKYLTLKEYLSKARSENSIFKLLLQAIDIRIETIKFLIPPESIVYDIDMSYYEPESKSLRMVFLPCNINFDEDDFKNWLREIIELSGLEDKNEDARSILRYMHSADFSLLNLKQRIILANDKTTPSLVDEEAYEVSEKKMIRGRDADYRLEMRHRREVEEKPINKYKAEQKPLYMPKRSQPSHRINCNEEFNNKPKLEKIEIKNKRDSKKDAIRDIKTKREKTDTETPSGVKFFLISQFFIVLLYLSACFFLKNKMDNPLKLFLGLFIIFALIDYSLIKIMKSKNLLPNRNDFNIPKRKTEKSVEIKAKPKKVERKNEAFSPSKNRETDIENCSTLCLDELKDYKRVLIDKKTGERIEITGKDYTIGRNSSESDYSIQDISIGRIHAFIRQEGEISYLIDNGSINGTFINGLRIKPHEYYEIKDGDELIISRLSYYYYILDN